MTRLDFIIKHYFIIIICFINKLVLDNGQTNNYVTGILFTLKYCKYRL